MRLRELEIALELKLYRQQHGSYPASLDELERAIGHPLPTNPLSGGQFAYQRQGPGVHPEPDGAGCAAAGRARDAQGPADDLGG